MQDNSLNEKLNQIKLLAMDVDGTMTDGAMFYNQDGEAMKKFSAADGMGITLLHRAGIKTGIITSVNSQIAKARANKLKMEYIKLDRFDKDIAIREISEESGIPIENIAFVGDDVNDLGAMEIVKLSVATANAVQAVKDKADYICELAGGYGAIREIAEKILICQKKAVILNID